jgi:hypothetical protein
MNNTAEAFIVRYFHPTEEHAEQCLQETPDGAEHAAEEDLRGIQEDARWAVRMIIVEKILLEAFRETQETVSLDTEGLIAVANRKIGTPGFAEEIVSYLQSIGKIPANRIPRFSDITLSVRTSFREIEEFLRGKKKEKQRKRKKAPGDPYQRFFEDIRRVA